MRLRDVRGGGRSRNDDHMQLHRLPSNERRSVASGYCHPSGHIRPPLRQTGPPTAETFVRKASVLSAGLHSIQHRLAMSQKPTTCGLDRCANGMNWSPAGRHLFCRSKYGLTTSSRSRNSTGCRIDWSMGCELVWTSLIGTKLPCQRRRPMSEVGGRTDSTRTCRHGRVNPRRTSADLAIG